MFIFLGIMYTKWKRKTKLNSLKTERRIKDEKKNCYTFDGINDGAINGRLCRKR